MLAIGTYVGDLHRLEHDLANAKPYVESTRALSAWVLKATSLEEAGTLRDFMLGTLRAA